MIRNRKDLCGITIFRHVNPQSPLFTVVQPNGIVNFFSESFRTGCWDVCVEASR